MYQSVLTSISSPSPSTHLPVEQKDFFGPQEWSNEVVMGNQASLLA